MTITLEDVRERDFTDNPDVRAEYERMRPVYALIGKLIKARTAAGLTQQQVADRLDTKQSVISRIENAGQMPSLAMAMRYAAVCGGELTITTNK